MSDLELAFANYEDVIRRQACGDRSEQAVAKARAKLIATLSHPDTQAGALQAVTEDELDAIESAFDYVFHFAKDPKDGHIAQNICDTLQRMEKRLRPSLAATQPNAAPGGKQRCVVGSKCDTCTCAEEPQAASLSNASGEQQSEGMSLAPGAAEIMGNALRDGHRNTRNTPRGHS